MNTNGHKWTQIKDCVRTKYLCLSAYICGRLLPPTMDPVMTTDFLFKEETHKIIGCSFEVLNTLGHGLLEKPYENAMVVEFKQQKIPFRQQPHFPVIYKSVHVGEYIPSYRFRFHHRRCEGHRKNRQQRNRPDDQLS